MVLHLDRMGVCEGVWSLALGDSSSPLHVPMYVRYVDTHVCTGSLDRRAQAVVAAELGKGKGGGGGGEMSLPKRRVEETKEVRVCMCMCMCVLCVCGCVYTRCRDSMPFHPQSLSHTTHYPNHQALRRTLYRPLPPPAARRLLGAPYDEYEKAALGPLFAEVLAFEVKKEK